MGAFFHGWRRKTGCVTLAVAMLLMALWIRSDILFDQVALYGNLFISNGGCLVWDWQGWGGPNADIIDWHSDKASPFDEAWYFGRDGVRLPYWALVAPLTLLSTYLIFRKPAATKASAPTD